MLLREILVAAFAALIALPPWAQAQDYPNKPIRMVTMFGENANSNRDRFAATKLGEQLGVKILIDSKPGGGGVIALRDVYRAQPMGYSLLLASNGLVGNTFAYKDPGYRIDDYTPVGVLGISTYAMVMNANVVPARNLAEFVAWVKASPGKVNFGIFGLAHDSNISAERFMLMSGINMTGVPYKGGDQLALAMLAGEVHVTWISINSARVRMQNKQIVGLAHTGKERSALLPDLPTFKELGYPEMDTATWFTLFAPSSIPGTMLNRLRAAYATASGAPEWKTAMERNGLDPFDGNQDQFMAMVRKEAAQLGADYKRLNLPQE